ncbi:MAG TPA: VWA domain-containing protein [Bryobacteraceae bacterium]|nr:VWA domain-containing protein [Bryobacteraceae bacterium]
MKKLFSIVCVAGVLLAQEPQKPLTPGDQDIIKVETHVVLVPVTVTDHGGNFVNGLTPYDFELFDNGKPQKITEDIASHPISLVMVIQANSVVEKFIPQIQKLGSMIESQLLGDSGEVAVIAFDHRFQTLLPFTSEPDKLGAALKKLKAGSSTAAVNDAVVRGINMLKTRDKGRRRVVMVIAENQNRGSEINTREVLSEADFNNVTIYPIDISKVIAQLTATPMYNRPNPIPPEARPITNGNIQTPTTDSQTDMGNWVPAFVDMFDLAKNVFIPNPLTVYAKYTGGQRYNFASQKDLESAVSKIGQSLHSVYMLSYSPTTLEEGGFHKIVVRVKHSDLKITTRDGYYWAGGPK